MTRSTLTTAGFEEYFERVEQAGNNIDAVCDEALSTGGEVLLEGMERRAPRKKGHLVARIQVVGPDREGNYHFIKVGIFNVDRDKELYFFYQENGSARNAAHPYLRPTFQEDLRAARAKMLEVFKSRGAL